MERRINQEKTTKNHIPIYDVYIGKERRYPIRLRNTEDRPQTREERKTTDS